MFTNKTFLTAEWRRLILITYAIDPTLLEEYLPKGLTLDTRNDHAFVSLVAFDFEKVRLKGIAVPFHTEFPEINLRFYVRQGEKRGVVFISELVPKFWITEIARRIYNEPYTVAAMHSEHHLNESNELEIFHTVTDAHGIAHSLRFFCDPTPALPSPDSTEAFFKEQNWGFGQDRAGNLTTFRVEHPAWKIHALKRRFQFTWDFGSLYGEKWAFLNTQIPYNSLVAEGSSVRVFPNKKA